MWEPATQFELISLPYLTLYFTQDRLPLGAFLNPIFALALIMFSSNIMSWSEPFFFSRNAFSNINLKGHKRVCYELRCTYQTTRIMFCKFGELINIFWGHSHYCIYSAKCGLEVSGWGLHVYGVHTLYQNPEFSHFLLFFFVITATEMHWHISPKTANSKLTLNQSPWIHAGLYPL